MHAHYWYVVLFQESWYVLCNLFTSYLFKFDNLKIPFTYLLRDKPSTNSKMFFVV